MKNQFLSPDILSPASKIASLIRQEIREGKYAVGQRLDNERDMAEQFGVSRGTIRQTLKILAAERLVIRQQGRGTFVADLTFAPPGENQTALIGAMVYEKEYYFGAILQGASSQSGQRGYMLTTGSNISQESEIQHAQAFLENRVRGVILAPKQQHSHQTYDLLISNNIPVIMLDTILSDRNEDFVSVDNRQGTFLSANHLIDLGHRKIAYLGHDCPSDFPCQTGRMWGFLDACKQSGISVPSHWILELNDDNHSPHLRNLLKDQSRPTAIVCYNDIWATRAITAARELGIAIPNGFSVVGFDDSYVARNHDIPITTVNPEPQELGRVAINLLVDKIEIQLQRPKCSILVSPKLIIRQSTAPAS